MKFTRLSRGTRITVVTSVCNHLCRDFSLNAIMDRGKWSGEKMLPREKFAWSGSSRRKLTGELNPVSLRAQPLQVSPFLQISDFHRPRWQLAGVKCELVTEVRPLP